MKLFFYLPDAREHSMLCSLRIGDRLLVEPVRPAALRRGDLVVFWLENRKERDSRWAVHRLLRKSHGADGWTFLARGDSSPSSDPPFGEKRLAGKVVKIKRDGVWRNVDGFAGGLRHRLAGAFGRAYFLAGGGKVLAKVRGALQAVYRSRRARVAPASLRRGLLRSRLWVEEALIPG